MIIETPKWLVRLSLKDDLTPEEVEFLTMEADRLREQQMREIYAGTYQKAD